MYVYVGRGVPINLISNSGTVPLNELEIPGDIEATASYISEGRVLTEEWVTDDDMLNGHDALSAVRDSVFEQTLLPQIGDAASIFGSLVNGYYQPFQQAVLMHIQLSEQLASSI